MVALNHFLTFLILFILYCIGSIPTGYWFSKYMFGLDITTMGSGNIGATNVARVLGDVRYFFLIFLIDAFKAFFSLVLSAHFFSYWYSQEICSNLLLLGAALLFFGNVHSIFLRFRGGKGVATLAGLVVYLLPLWLMGIFVGVWALVLLFTRTMYLASLGGAFVMVTVYWLNYFYPTNLMAYFLGVLFVLLVVRHKRNICEAFNCRY